MTNDSTTTDVIRLLLAVARLGEADLRGWWRGHALDSTGGYVLSSMFPRTWRAAALELDVAAAARLHDERLGRTTALHLFSDRLPFKRWTAAWLAEQKMADEQDPLLAVLAGWSTQAPTDVVRTWCGDASPRPAELINGSLLLGTVLQKDLDDPVRLLRIASMLTAAYLDQTGPICPPYFDLAL